MFFSHFCNNYHHNYHCNLHYKYQIFLVIRAKRRFWRPKKRGPSCPNWGDGDGGGSERKRFFYGCLPLFTWSICEEKVQIFRNRHGIWSLCNLVMSMQALQWGPAFRTKGPNLSWKVLIFLTRSWNLAFVYQTFASKLVTDVMCGPVGCLLSNSSHWNNWMPLFFGTSAHRNRDPGPK